VVVVAVDVDRQHVEVGGHVGVTQEGVQPVGFGESDERLDRLHPREVRAVLAQLDALGRVRLDEHRCIAARLDEVARVAEVEPVPRAELHAPAVGLRQPVEDLADHAVLARP